MENNAPDLKSLWVKRTTPPPASDIILQKIKNFQRYRQRCVMRMNIALTTSSLVIIFVWMYYQPELLSTKIGIVLVVAAMGMSMWFHNRSLSLYTNIDSSQTNSEYLQRLMAIAKKETFLQTTVLSSYSLMLTAGISLYMFEYATRMSTLTAALAYGITFAWILLSWFYFRPRQIKKQRGRLDEIIDNAQKIQDQLETES